MLHSLSHMLLTRIALDCGYPAAALRERIYALPDLGMYGTLIHTGTSGSEGTLGGLVESGRRIGEHLIAGLEEARLCSNDPVCAEHNPSAQHDPMHLQGAACHGCLLIAETSCEQRNDGLDRALVVPTIAVPDAAFFPRTPARSRPFARHPRGPLPTWRKRCGTGVWPEPPQRSWSGTLCRRSARRRPTNCPRCSLRGWDRSTQHCCSTLSPRSWSRAPMLPFSSW
jgi:hypothetical protein